MKCPSDPVMQDVQGFPGLQGWSKSCHVPTPAIMVDHRAFQRSWTFNRDAYRTTALRVLSGDFLLTSLALPLSPSLSICIKNLYGFLCLKTLVFPKSKFSTHRLKSQNHLFPRIFSLKRSLGNGRFPCIMHKCPNKCITTWPEIHAERVEWICFSLAQKRCSIQAYSNVVASCGL